ncbi:twin-arginine translocation signal domain-containing protein [Arthrobacter alpinus]|nr:twin-arginine translocation signal domain-containing protein [Arthrobacter alpinus]
MAAFTFKNPPISRRAFVTGIAAAGLVALVGCSKKSDAPWTSQPRTSAPWRASRQTCSSRPRSRWISPFFGRIGRNFR